MMWTEHYSQGLLFSASVTCWVLQGCKHNSFVSLVPRPSASRARNAYVTFEPLSDSWQKAWYHSYVIHKQGGHDCDVGGHDCDIGGHGLDNYGSTRT